jgi:hypothetical protein
MLHRCAKLTGAEVFVASRNSGSVWIERVTSREEPCQFRWAVQYPAQRAPPE